MASKEVKSLKPKDKFLTACLSGTKAISFWAEVTANPTLRSFDTGTMKHREIHELKYKIISGPKAGENHTVLLNPEDKVVVADRPMKIVRIWNEIVSK